MTAYPETAVPPSLAALRGSRADHALRLGAFAIFCSGLWLIVGRYWGLEHDAQGYVVQALAVLKPDIYAGDIFLRFRSQEEFTLFPRLLALLVDRWGIDTAAAFATLASLAAWLVSAWLLIKTVVPRPFRSLSIAFVLLIPIGYGAGSVFTLAEPFVSARPAAEALSMAGMALALRRQWFGAIALLLVAALLHPLMAFPAILIALILALPENQARFAIGSAVAVFVLALAGSWILGQPYALMNETWLHVTRSRTDYLFLDQWQPRDWQTLLLSIATVVIAARRLTPGSAGARFVLTSTLVAVVGLALTAVTTWIAPFTILLQGQPWRWIWPAAFLAVALLPLLAAVCWRAGPAGRSVVLALLAGWLLVGWSSAADVPPVGVGGLLALTAYLIDWRGQQLNAAALRLVLRASVVVIALVLVGLVLSVAATLQGQFGFGTDPLWVETTGDLLKLTPVLALVTALAWYACTAARRLIACVPVGLAGLLLWFGAGPGAFASWTESRFVDDRLGEFDEWRQIIPTDAEILWPEELQAVWFLLERRSYISVSQGGGVVFSDDLSRTLVARAEELQPMADPSHWMIDGPSAGARRDTMTREILAAVCERSSAGFVVSEIEVEGRPPVATAQYPAVGRWVYLHACN